MNDIIHKLINNKCIYSSNDYNFLFVCYFHALILKQIDLTIEPSFFQFLKKKKKLIILKISVSIENKRIGND